MKNINLSVFSALYDTRCIPDGEIYFMNLVFINVYRLQRKQTNAPQTNIKSSVGFLYQ